MIKYLPILTLALCGSLPVQGAVIAYDGFDYSNDNSTIVGQSSTERTGFSNSDAWATDSTLASVVNYHSVGSGLSYSGGDLATSGGALSAFRTNTFRSTTGVNLSSTPFTANSGSTEYYFSVLVNANNFTPDSEDYVRFAMNHGNVTSTNRYFGFHLDNGGISTVEGGSSLEFTSPVATGESLAAGTNLLVFRVTDKTSGGSDEFEMWLNPDTTNPGAADYSSTISLGLVVGNGSYGFGGIELVSSLSEDSVLFDEFRLGTSFEDVTPVPEPATMALFAGLVGLAAAFVYRRRR